jgi:hypothetical protein
MADENPFELSDEEAKKRLEHHWNNENQWNLRGLFLLAIYNDRASSRQAKSTNRLSMIAIVISVVALVTQVLFAICLGK